MSIDTTRPLAERPVILGDIEALKDEMSLDNLDTQWLLTRQPSISAEQHSLAVNSIPTCLLIRHLIRFPEHALLPTMPTVQETLEEVNAFWPETRNFSARKLALITGNAGWTGSRWTREDIAPAHATRRLFYVLTQLSRSESLWGVQNYLDVVEEELGARGILGGFEELVQRGSWPRRIQASTETSSSKRLFHERSRFMSRLDIEQLKNQLGIDNLDTHWLLTQIFYTQPDTRHEPLTSIPVSLLVRTLLSMPELNPLPRHVNVNEALDRIAPAWPESRELSARKLALLTGNTGWTGARWVREGVEPAYATKRLFLLLTQVAETQGMEGIEQFMASVHQELRARGIFGGFDQLVHEGAWPRNSQITENAEPEDETSSGIGA